MGDEEDGWWGESCRLAKLGEDGFGEGGHESCDAIGCDCKCHNPRVSFQPTGDGAFRVSGVRVNPTTGLYVTERSKGRHA